MQKPKCSRRPHVRYRAAQLWGGHQLHHTHSNMRRAFCLPEELVGLILSPLSTQEEDA